MDTEVIHGQLWREEGDNLEPLNPPELLNFTGALKLCKAQLHAKHLKQIELCGVTPN